ncbi:hypothetical protein FQN52_005434 [Onygenales sp. PD_12]|nr:hypothetical protein FQN52_005434 [Onygenales sp. PD_12]
MQDNDQEAQPLLSSLPNSSDNSQELPQETGLLRSVESGTIPETATYGRNLTWRSAYILVMSRVIGSGIFATPGAIVKAVGSIGLTLVLWVVGAIIAGCGLAVSLEYGCMLPRSGGHKIYLEFTYRYPKFLASTLVAMQAVVLGFTASNCIIFGEYVLFALGREPTVVMQRSLSIGLLTTITVIHGCFLKSGIRIQNFLGWTKILLSVFMVLTGLYVVVFHREDSLSTKSTIFCWDAVWADSNWSWGILSTALFKVAYAYAGLDNANNVLNEVKDPVRTLKFVGPLALVTACMLYLLVIVAYFIVVPITEIKESGELVAAIFFNRVFGRGFGQTILPLAIAISAAGNVMVVTFTLARVNQEIARQGFLPYSEILSSSRPFNTPLGGLIVHYIPSLLVIILPPPGDAYNFILDVEAYPAQFFALATACGILLLRARRPELARPFKAWIPAVWIKIAMCLALIVAPFFPPKDWKGDVGFFYATYAIVGLGLIVLAVLYWYFWTVAIPRWMGYTLEEEVEVLPDGTAITKLVSVDKLST